MKKKRLLAFLLFFLLMIPTVSVAAEEIEPTSQTTEASVEATASEALPQSDLAVMEEENMPVLFASTGSGTCGTGVKWTLDSSGTLQISGSGAMADYAKGKAPWYTRRSSIKWIIVENGVSRIGNYAFYECTAASSLSIGNYAASSIGEGAFYNCSALSTFIFSFNLKTIEDYAFYGCHASSITIPQNVATLSSKAFVNFNVKSFDVNSYNSYFTAKNGVLFNRAGTELVAYPGGATATSYTLPYGTEKIRPYAFSENHTLQTVSMNTSADYLTEIGEGAFAGCTVLTKVTLPGSLKSVGENAFSLDTLTTATYECTESTWNSWVTVGSGNTDLTDILTYGTIDHPFHPICGSECTCTDTTHMPMAWYSWNGTGNISSSYYYLSKDVTRESWYNINGNVKICLNDHKIVTNGKAPGFEIKSAGTLFITDCGTNGTISSTDGVDSSNSTAERAIENWGRFTLYNGTLIAGETTIYDNFDSDLNNSPAITIYKGTVKGTNGSIEGGGTTNIYGGTFDGNFSAGGETTIYDGTFLGEVYNGLGGTMTIKGGTVSIDTHEYLQSAIHNQGTMTIEDVDVSFTGNGYGNAVSNSGTLHLNGGTFPAVKHTESNGKTVQHYSLINSIADAHAYISGKPALEAICVEYPDTLTFTSEDGSATYKATNGLKFRVNPYYFGSGIAASAVTDTIENNITQINYYGDASDEDGTLFRSGNNLVFSPASGKCGENLTWRFDSATGTLIISGTGPMYTYDEDDEREEYCPWWAFASNIKAIDFPDGITTIGYYAFSDLDALTSVTIPDSVTRIGEGAFVNCSNLQTVDLGNGCSLGDMAFCYCPVKNLTLGGTGSFGTQAFSSSYLTSITITANSPSFGEAAFFNCTNLKEVHFQGSAPNSVTDKGWIYASFRDDVTWYYDCSQSGWTTSGRYSPTNKTWAGYTLVSEKHAYQEKIVPPTCTEQGYTAQECICGDSYPIADTYVPAKGHTEVIDNAVESTCTETGLSEGKHCSVCGEVTVAQEITPVKGHTEVIDKAVEPTCTETGLTEGKHCDVCDKVLTAQEIIPAKDHDYTGKVTTEATCKKEGVMTYTCQNDASHTYTEAIPMKDHTEVTIEGEEATCTETGTTDGKYCSVCNTMLTIPAVIPAKGHTEVTDAAVEPTCTETGLTEGKHCSVCSEVLVAQEVVPVKDHTEIIDNAVEPTCTETGLTEGSHCDVCGKILTPQETVPEIGHDYVGKVTSESTCNQEGVMTYTCQNDASHTYTEAIPMKDHTEVTIKGKEATCTETGKTDMKYCSVCGTVTVVQEIIPAKDHTEVIDEGKEPTCTETGLTEGKHCDVCGEVTVPQTEIPATGHTEVTVPGKPATGTETGLTDGIICSVCGEVLKEQEVIEVEIPSGKCGDNLTWILNLTSGILTINGTGSMYDYSNPATRPWAEYADSITSVVMKGGTSVGQNAFYSCTNLTGVTLPTGLNAVGSSAFENCSSLNSAALPEGLETIGRSAFKNTGLAEVIVPASVKTMSTAFSGCISLKKATLLGNPSTWDGAFKNCTALTDVTLPNNLNGIAASAFSGCTALTEISIPSSVRTISDSAFANTSLTEINLPNNLISIGANAFDGAKISSIIIPASVTAIGTNAFVNCTSLTDIIVKTGNVNYAAENGALMTNIIDGVHYADPPQKFYVLVGYAAGRSTVELPDSVTAIEAKAFSGKTKYTKIHLPEGITLIHSNAFYELNSVTEIVIPETASRIQDFDSGPIIYNCSALKKLDVHSKSITAGALAHDCSALAELLLPKTLTHLYLDVNIESTSGVFLENCQNLVDLHIPYQVNDILLGTLPGDHEYINLYFHTAEPPASVSFNSVGSSDYEVNIYYLDEYKDTHGSLWTNKFRSCNVRTWAKEDHDAVMTTITDKTAPTCTEPGYDLYGCRFCDAAKKVATSPENGHTYQEIIAEEYLKTPATCTTDAVYYKFCSVCGKVGPDSFVAPDSALGHTETITPGIPATETSPGLTEGKHCSVCGEITVPQTEIPVTGHTFIETFLWADDLASATAVLTCNCGHSEEHPCELTWDNSQSSKLIVTATLEANGQTFSESKEISATKEGGSITLTFDAVYPNMKISAAAYNNNGQMTAYTVPENIGKTVTLNISGDQVRIFFMTETYCPISPSMMV